MASFSDAGGREALALGSYYPNHFLLRFGASAEFLKTVMNAEGVPEVTYDPHFMSVFWHEYIHYWHNVSTVSGFKSLFSTHHVLGAVSQVVVSSGTFDDVVPLLNDDDRSHLEGVILLDSSHNGQGSVAGLSTKARIERVVSYRVEPNSVQLRDGPANAPSAIVTLELSDPANGADGQAAKSVHEYVLGALAIEESAAALAQDVIDQEENTAHALFVPDLPYRVVERLFEHIVKVDPTPFQCFAAATLALMRAHPGPGLLEALEGIRAGVARGLSVDESIDEVERASRERANALLNSILSDSLPELVVLHEGRSLMHEGILDYERTFRQASAHRQEDLLFDARRFFAGDAVKMVNRQMTEYPPCDMLQERIPRDGEFPRDLLVAPGVREESPLRAFHAQQHLAHHLARSVIRSSKSPSCPFYDACNLDYRKDQSERCRNRPWEWRQESPTCWYGIAAAALRGKVAAKNNEQA